MNRLAPVIALLLGCSAPSSAQASATYPEALAAVEEARRKLADEYDRASRRAARAEVLERAKAELFAAIRDRVLPAWYGTPWAFHGASEVPGEGAIACGYLVTTVLRDAGLNIERVALARSASERIVRSLAPAKGILRFSNSEIPALLARVRLEGDGVYVVGMDWHVGLLVLDGDRADLCHSTMLEPVAVVCEPAETSPGMASGYHVVGPVLNERVVRAWLTGEAIPSAP